MVKKKTKKFIISLTAAFAQTQLKLTVCKFYSFNSDDQLELDVHRVYFLMTNFILLRGI